MLPPGMDGPADYDVLIVGAGHAGAELAIALSGKGFGGKVLLAGEEADAPYERPPLSKAYLLGTITVERLMLRGADYWAEAGIDLALGCRVAAIDAAKSTAALADGRQVRYRWCVLATGGRVRRLGCPGGDLPGIHTLRTRADVDAIRAGLAAARHMVIIGAGYVGLEVAAAARELGLEVTVVEAQRRVLSRVTSPVISDFYQHQHRARGVDIRLGARVRAIVGAGRVEGVLLDDGARLPADIVVAGIGIDAETALAEEAGLRCDGGVLVDAHCRTSVPNILAIGDCSRHPGAHAGLLRLESVQHANDSAAAAAETIMGTPSPYAQVPTFWSEQYDLRLQTAGIAADADDLVVRGDPLNGPLTVVYLSGGRIIAVDAVNAPRDFMAARTLIRNGARPERARIADPAVTLKSLA